jgi:hypothetical protein
MTNHFQPASLLAAVAGIWFYLTMNTANAEERTRFDFSTVTRAVQRTAARPGERHLGRLPDFGQAGRAVPVRGGVDQSDTARWQVSMNTLLTGASGFIGSVLGSRLTKNGHCFVPLRRASADSASGPTWNPAAGQIHLEAAGPLDAVVHLAGENIAQRWTTAAKARIRASRADATRLLCEALVTLPQPPRVLVCASATGCYGDRGDEVLDEQRRLGTGFLPEVCRAWEAVADPARVNGIRVVHLRLGIVLPRHGGALAKMLPVFRLGLGGRLGDGRQYWSWITLEDLLRLVEWTSHNDGVSGAVNAVSPGAVTNADFTRALARAMRRPAFLAVPAVAGKLLFGEMGREALLGSARVRPTRLLESRFEFRFPQLDAAFGHGLQQSSQTA